MTWRARLRPASFRGVPFFVAEAENNGGHRHVVHQYPMRRDPFIEELGLDARNFTITGFILGPNYFGPRDALISALEKGGAATLVHPYRGTKKVHAASWSFRELSEDGGIVYFQIEFVQAGLQQYPSATKNPLSMLGSAADALAAAARGEFLQNITLSGVPDFVIGGMTETLSQIGGVLEGLQDAGGLLDGLGTQGLINQAARFGSLVRSLTSGAHSMLGDPLGLASTLQALISGIGSLSGNPTSAIGYYRKLRVLPVATRDEVTALVALENRNRTATKRFTDLLSLAGEARALPAIDFGSHDEALAARSIFLSSVEQYSDTPSDTEYHALQSLRTEIARAVPGVDRELPRLDAVTLPASQPALVLAYELYGKVSREAEIVSRNKVSHPGFLPAGVKLEVLSA